MTQEHEPYEPGYPSLSLYPSNKPPPIYEKSWEFFLKYGRACDIPQGFTHDEWRAYELKHPPPILYTKWKVARNEAQKATEESEKLREEVQCAQTKIKTLAMENKRLQTLLAEACQVIKQHAIQNNRDVKVTTAAPVMMVNEHGKGMATVGAAVAVKKQPIQSAAAVDWRSRANAHKKRMMSMSNAPPLSKTVRDQAEVVVVVVTE